jgi:hypothetical protein
MKYSFVFCAGGGGGRIEGVKGAFYSILNLKYFIQTVEFQ